MQQRAGKYFTAVIYSAAMIVLCLLKEKYKQR